MFSKPKTKREIRGWACVKYGKIVLEDFYSNNDFRPYKVLAIFKSKKNLKTYAVHPEEIVPISITLLPKSGNKRSLRSK